MFARYADILKKKIGKRNQSWNLNFESIGSNSDDNWTLIVKQLDNIGITIYEDQTKKL